MVYLFCSFILILCILSYINAKFINIAFVYAAIWGALTLFAILLGMPTTEQGYFFIFVNVFIFCVCYFLGCYKKRGKSKKYEVNEIIFSKKILLFNNFNKIVLFINIVAMVYLGIKLGFRLSTFRNVYSLMLKMNEIAHSRYANDSEQLPFINRIVNCLVYATSAYCGFFMVKKASLKYLFNLLAIFFQVILTNTKATFVFGFAFWMGGFITGLNFYQVKLSRKKSFVLFLSIIGALCFGVLINYLRHNGKVDIVSEITKILNAYFIGPCSAFSIWFANNYDKLDIEFGANTFSCVFRILGIKEQQHGEFVTILGVTNNVYTIFKHLVNDFSTLGTIAISGLLGIFSSFIDFGVRNSKKYVSISIVILTTIIVSFFSSVFRYTTNILACFLISIFSILFI